MDTCELLKTGLIKPLERRLFSNDLSQFYTLFLFFDVNEHLAVPFIKLARGLMSAIWISSLYTRLLVWAFPQSHELILLFEIFPVTCIFCFLFICMVDETQMYPSSISPLGLFQGIICNIDRMKGGTFWTLNYWGNLI